MKPLTAFRWFIEYGGRLDSNWVNDVTLSLGGWQPGVCGPHLRRPVLMLVSPQDEMTRANPRTARAVFDSICGPKEWYAIGGGHFGLLYHPSELFSEARAVQLGFLRRWADGEMHMPVASSDLTGDDSFSLAANRNHLTPANAAKLLS